MYWLVVLLGVAAWMLATRPSLTEAEAPGHRLAEHTALSRRWNRATGIQRAGLVAMTIGRVAWVGLIMLTFVAVVIGTATWMY
jgi:hypothetical protein